MPTGEPRGCSELNPTLVLSGTRAARPQRPGPAGVPRREPPGSGAWCAGAGVGGGRGPTKDGGGPGPPTLHSESGRRRRSAGRRGQCGPGPPPRASRTRPQQEPVGQGVGRAGGPEHPGAAGLGRDARGLRENKVKAPPGAGGKTRGAPEGWGNPVPQVPPLGRSGRGFAPSPHPSLSTWAPLPGSPDGVSDPLPPLASQPQPSLVISPQGLHGSLCLPLCTPCPLPFQETACGATHWARWCSCCCCCCCRRLESWAGSLGDGPAGPAGSSRPPCTRGASGMQEDGTARSGTCAVGAASTTAPCPTWVPLATATSSATAPSPTAAPTSGTSAWACRPRCLLSQVGIGEPGRLASGSTLSTP